MKMWLPIGLAFTALIVVGCAAVSVPPASAVVPPHSIPNTPEQALTYHVFLGELAELRGDRHTALQQYAQAAQSSRDVSLVAYATLLAYRSGEDPLALNLSHRWLQLSPDDPAALHFEAILDTRLGHVDLAVSEFERLLRQAPGESLMPIGEMLAQEAGPQQGLPVMQKLTAARPQSAEAHFALGRLALHYDQPRLAVDEARLARKLKPNWDSALVLEARALLADGNQEEALQLLQSRTQDVPGNVDLQLAYGALLAELGRNTEAQRQFTLVLKQTANNPDALYSLGLLALQDKQLDQAKAYFLRLLHTTQRNNEAFYFLGSTTELSKQYADALQWYQQVDGGQYWLPAQIGTARVLLAQDKAAAARDFLDGLVSADPDDGVQFRLAEAQLFSDTHDAQAAMEVFTQALTEYPDNTDLLYARALLYESLGQVSAAENDLRLVLAHQSENADALNALGYTLAVHTTRYQEARTYIARALQLKPDDPAIMDSMGWVEYQLGDYGQALGYLRKSYAQLPDPEVAAHLSEALWATGDKQGARSVWSAALKQHPDNAALIKLNPRFLP